MIENLSQEQKDKLLEKLLKKNNMAHLIHGKEEPKTDEGVEETTTESKPVEKNAHKAAIKKIREALSSLPDEEETNEETTDEETTGEEPMSMTSEDTMKKMKEKVATDVAVKNLKKKGI